MASIPADEMPDAIGQLTLHWAPGVRTKNGAVEDDVLAESFAAGKDAMQILQRIQDGTTVRDATQGDPEAWGFLAYLNENHLLNARSPSFMRGSGSLGSRLARTLLGRDRRSWAGSSLHRFRTGLGDSLFGNLRSVGHCVASMWRLAPWLAPLCWVWTLGAILLPVPSLLVTILPLVLLGYLVHELGHAMAASHLGLPGYVMADRVGVSVWILPERTQTRSLRLFAAAGPGLAVLVGLALLFARALGAPIDSAGHALPFLAHAVVFTPLFHDGRILWRRAGAVSPKAP